MNEHEINSQLITEKYRLMKHLIYAILALLLLASCSKDSEWIDSDYDEAEEPKEEMPVQEIFRFKLSAKKTVLNIFDLAELSILDSKGVSFIFRLHELASSYDSIVWQVKGLDGRLRIFNNRNGSGISETTLTSNWGHCFYLSGNHEAYLHGYKGNKMIYGDTLRMEVTDTKSFLGRNWSDTNDLGENIGHNNALNEHFSLATLANVYDGTPAINLRLINSGNLDQIAFTRKSEKELYAYMVQLYGKPIYEKDSPDLVAQYSTFAVRSPKAVPLAYWATGKAKIILLREEDPEWRDLICYIHTEPV